MKIKNILNKISKIQLKKKYLRWKAKRSLLKRYTYLIEIQRLMEEFITQDIINGATNRRQELIQKQAELKEMEKLLNFFKKI